MTDFEIACLEKLDLLISANSIYQNIVINTVFFLTACYLFFQVWRLFDK